jgi:hypothetical protein
MIGAILLVVMVTSPVRAQQSANIAASDVPDNIAPHPAPTQPLPFSHKTHLAAGPVCTTCHVNPEPGNQMTYPATDTCMACHVAIATDKASIASLRAFAESGQKIPWVRVYAITPGVTWSHRPHLLSGADCETCHGDIRQAESVSESTAILAMATCIGCHKARGAKTDCVTCHAWPTDQVLGTE